MPLQPKTDRFQVRFWVIYCNFHNLQRSMNILGMPQLIGKLQN